MWHERTDGVEASLAILLKTTSPKRISLKAVLQEAQPRFFMGNLGLCNVLRHQTNRIPATLISGEVPKPELERLGRHFTPGGRAAAPAPGHWLFPGAFAEAADKVYNFKWKEEDVVVTGFLKTGTTWLQEILWTKRNNPNLDRPLANRPILDRVPIIEFITQK
ncbi:uncharacterized protein LOC134764220 [Penaeus indicus]|uniref:uncharacterized protein LOC134764220 n=1 Tax=Penaeus indicus TaxID=29960 RepID=UPI00300C92D0